MSEQTDNIVLDLDYVKSYMDKSYELTFIDWDSSLDNDLKSVNEAIQKQELYPIDESQDEWLMETQMQGMDYAYDELMKEICNAGDFSEEEIDKFFEDNREYIEEEIGNRDTSTPISDLIRHTSDPVVFYDLCIDIDYNYDKESYDNNFQAVKEALGINDDTYDKNINQLLIDASYGGRLVVYFVGDIATWMNINEKGYNTIQFKHPNIAVIDRMNGSGSNDWFRGLELSFPLDLENVYIDKIMHYNYTYEVCGMSDNWCDDTIVRLEKV